ncbi:hypothetical protein FLAG1_12025 [Fusarium langsethiae]|uniref:Uncharacterized protein n=1 Tax=Fusarium langsethiae TaxID=179993 RepID=A0A0N0DAG2_FUSLA|nr:hypothetical protein FLAG1_12025 [Fusarium langsethiae]
MERARSFGRQRSLTDMKLSRPVFRANSSELFFYSTTRIFKSRHGTREYVFELLLVHSSSDDTLHQTFRAAERFLEGHEIPFRVSKIILNEEQVCRDGPDSFEETVTQLKGFLETPQFKGLRFLDKFQRWVYSHLNELPHLLILTDALGSCLMKGVALKGTSGIPPNTDVLLFFEQSKELDIQQSISQSAEKVTTGFNRMILQHNSPDPNRLANK